MKRLTTILLLMLAFASGGMAQTTMTDNQVIKFIVKEHEAGTSQAQIVTKLMQKGVDIQQIRRVKTRYEAQLKRQGMQNQADKAMKEAEDRMRKPNGESKTDRMVGRVKGVDKYGNALPDEQTQLRDMRSSAEYKRMQTELDGFFAIDSTDVRTDEEGEEILKKVFGRDIFNKENLTFEPNMNIATPQNYRLGPGDAVLIDVYGASQKSVSATVSPDGDVNIEGFGPVQVSGLTIAEANSRLKSQLGARYSSSKVRLTLGQTRTITVNVMGEVKAPGTYTLSAFASVFHALYMAGGTNNLGTLRNIKVYRNNKLVTQVDVYDYILNGKLTGNVRLGDNDVIVVGPYDCIVEVTGNIKRPMYYEMKRSESVGTLLKYAGGFAGDAYTKSVRLVRKTGREYSIYNVAEVDYNTFHLADGDRVTIDPILSRFSNMVELKGAVFRPGMYQVGKDISSVRSLITHAEGVTEDAFTAHAVLHRMKPDRTLEVIQVDVDGIMSGKVADIALKPNDILFVPTKQELMQQRTITIHGEVNYPGIYQYADNETIEDFVLQAGGLKETASTVKVEVSRRIVDPKAMTTDSIIARSYSFALKDGFVIDGEPGFVLQPYDEVYVRRSPGYYTQRNVTVEGQVMFSGTYTLTGKNERLSDVIRKAGGVTDMAYVNGARVERKITPDERRRMETIWRMAQVHSDGNDSLAMNKMDFGEVYYVGIELGKALDNPGSNDDLVLREGDRIIVPEYDGTVKISGDVLYPNTVAYEKGKRPSYYINQAGGFGDRAKKSHTYIVYMNGKVARVGHNAVVKPGCEILVPSKPKRNGRALAEWLSVGTSVASIATMIATIANLIK